MTTTEEDYGWAVGLGPQFLAYWEGTGGDYPTTTNDRPFLNHFEKKYVKAVYQECLVYIFRTRRNPYFLFYANGTNKNLFTLFEYFMGIRHPHFWTTEDEELYEKYPYHPIQDMIIQNFPMWQENSHEQIQNFIYRKINARRYLYDYTIPDEAIQVFCETQHARLGPNSPAHSLDPAILGVIRQKLRESYSLESIVDEEEATYLASLK